MPLFDRTGPRGLGPRTGWGRGFCPPAIGAVERVFHAARYTPTEPLSQYLRADEDMDVSGFGAAGIGVVDRASMRTFDPESFSGLGNVNAIVERINELRARVKEMKANAISAARDPNSRAHVAEKVVELVGQIARAKSQGVEGLWDSITGAVSSAAGYVYDNAVGVVTGVNPSEIAAAEQQVQAQTVQLQEAIARREAAGDPPPQVIYNAVENTGEVLDDLRQTASLIGVLTNTAKEALNTANKALGDPLGIFEKYVKYAAVAGGGLAVLYVFLKAKKR
jgi:hypothetical protein